MKGVEKFLVDDERMIEFSFYYKSINIALRNLSFICVFDQVFMDYTVSG